MDLFTDNYPEYTVKGTDFKIKQSKKNWNDEKDITYQFQVINTSIKFFKS